MDAGGKSQGTDNNGGEGCSRMVKSCGETPVAGFAAESSSQLVRPLASQLVDPEEAKLESEVQKGGPVHEEEGMKQCQLPTATSAEQQVPWFGFEKACTFVSQSGKNVVVRCNYCLPRIKNLRSAVSSSSNVKKHFERAHPEKLRAIEEAIKARRRGLPEPMRDTPPPKMLKQQQTTLERWGSGRDLLLLAACVHPRFKLDRLESCQATTHTNKYTMEPLLKAEIKMGVLNEDGDQSSDKDQEGDDLEDDFFNFLPQGKKSAVDTAKEELVRYLRSPSREVSSLHGFPRVLRCFLQHNTGMPSSAAVECLFSTGGNVMTVKRHSLSDMLFEHLVLLRHNRNIL
ncbi:uncharacterized protein LOC133383418 [Rhineura floridana]|uniref:uncharacterized protein LOC133383418 n=1 Tax=Rhineura floridana TaxID=261503 RepID=UPI002AC80219|nr:uncharacterized protein LOC133383418 [Rhineura floridana]